MIGGHYLTAEYLKTENDYHVQVFKSETGESVKTARIADDGKVHWRSFADFTEANEFLTGLGYLIIRLVYK